MVCHEGRHHLPNVHHVGAIIVTTLQDVAVADAVKGVEMFRKVNIPVLTDDPTVCVSEAFT